MIFLLLPTYPISTSTITSSFSEKNVYISAFENNFFFILSALLWKWKSLMIFSLSCNYNNDMTYNWPNSAFFNFQKNANQVNCRQYSCILFFITKNLTKREFIVEPSFFTSWTIRSEKCARAHVQQNKTIYLSIYLSIWKPFWKRVYVYIYIYIYIYIHTLYYNGWHRIFWPNRSSTTLSHTCQHHAEITQSHFFAALIRLTTTTHNLRTFNISEISSNNSENSAYWQINTSGLFS